VDPELIGVTLKMSVEISSKLGREKIFRSFPNATGLALRAAAKVLLNVTLAFRRRKPS
jgi:hypothetical protein